MIEYVINGISNYYNTLKPIGDKVLLKKLIDKTTTKTYGDIVLPDGSFKNGSFGIAEVVDLGNDKSIEDSGLKKGDHVLYDYYSVFNDNEEYVLTKIENIILQLSETEARNLITKRMYY